MLYKEKRDVFIVNVLSEALGKYISPYMLGKGDVGAIK